MPMEVELHYSERRKLKQSKRIKKKKMEEKTEEVISEPSTMLPCIVTNFETPVVSEEDSTQLPPIADSNRIDSVCSCNTETTDDLMMNDFSMKPQSLMKLLHQKSASLPSTSTRSHRRKEYNPKLKSDIASWLINAPQKTRKHK
jgi:hypothetical protein